MTRRALAPWAGLAGCLLAAVPAYAGETAHGHDEPAVAAVSSPSIKKPEPLDDPEAPARLIRALQDNQDKIAAGDAAAYAAQGATLRDLTERFLAAPPDAWSTVPNAQALASFLFSGGQPRVARSVLAGATLAPAADNLVKGALASAENREASAKALLLPLDAMLLPASVGGQLALVQAGLLLREDRAGALRLFDRARLLSPGTLVEEAALRREVFVTGENLDTDLFVRLAEQYGRRFTTSPYAGNFTENLGRLLVQIAVTEKGRGLAKIEDLVATRSAGERRALFLAVARVAVLNGDAGLGLATARRALELSPEGSLEAARAHLYEAAALAVDDPEASGRALAAAPLKILPPNEVSLRAAVAEATRRVLAPPEGPGLAPERSDLIDAVEQALGTADATLRART